jgi:hypothetical protein
MSWDDELVAAAWAHLFVLDSGVYGGRTLRGVLLGGDGRPADVEYDWCARRGYGFRRIAAQVLFKYHAEELGLASDREDLEEELMAVARATRRATR